jgi:hypothetical protein
MKLNINFSSDFPAFWSGQASCASAAGQTQNSRRMVVAAGLKQQNGLKFGRGWRYLTAMSNATAEILQTCEALTPAKQEELADFARFLHTRQVDETRGLETVVAHTWNQLGSAPEIDYDQL